MKNYTFKKFFLVFLLLELFLSYSPALAIKTVDGYDYSNAGVSKQIKDYLCAPSDVNISQTANFGSGSGNNFQTSALQTQAAYGNANSADLYLCINQMYKFAIVVASVVGVFFIVIAGYVYISSEGNAESVEKAKSMVTSTIASLVILFGGYVFLKAMNPDLIQFHSVQPPSVRISDLSLLPAPNNVLVSLNADGSAPVSIQGGVGSDAASQLLAAGCTFQTPKQNTESANMTQMMFDKLKGICSDASSSGGDKPAISSVIGEGQHAANSYHYKGCAIDFADGIGNGMFSIKTKTGRPIGIAIYNAAIKNGISPDRIDPGTDADQTYHIHIDLGSSCPSK